MFLIKNGLKIKKKIIAVGIEPWLPAHYEYGLFQWRIQHGAFGAHAPPSFCEELCILLIATRESVLPYHLQLRMFVPLPLPTPESAPRYITHAPKGLRIRINRHKV